MLDELVKQLIAAIQTNYNAEFLSVITWLICLVFMTILLRFKATGMIVYTVVVSILANIQVLYLAKFTVFSEPIALGTVLFTTTFLASDIMTEHFDSAIARKGVFVSLLTQFFITVIMILTLAHPLFNNTKHILYTAAHQQAGALSIVFTPSVKILCASLIAYLVSQLADIAIFKYLKNHGSKLWIRMQLSTFIAGLLDNLVFSIIAWGILSKQPLGWYNIITTYVISSQLMRIVQNIFSTPFIYFSYRILGKQRCNIKNKNNIQQ